MTAEEVLEAALAEAALYTDKLPGSHTPLYRRMNVRQQELFQAVAVLNDNFFGRCAVGALDGGGVSIAAMDVEGAGAGELPPAVERLTRVEIADQGTSAYAAGDEVHVVDLRDQDDVALPPRVTHRDNVLRAVGTDLDGVVSLRIHYSRRPPEITGPADLVELAGAGSELLVLDLAKMILRLAEQAGPLTVLADEEKAALARFEAHVAGFSPVTSR